MKSEFARAVVGSVLRWILAGLAGYLVREGVLTDSQVSTLILGLAGLLVSLGWSLYQKHRQKIRLLLAEGPPEAKG